jgi:transposase
MPQPYSAELRERVLLAHEYAETNASALAARFRVAVNTVKNWVRAAATEGRRLTKPRGSGPAPRLGAGSV